jgi:hypothetical protein
MGAMKLRWIGTILLAAVIALGGCAPSQTGGDADASEEPAPVQAAPSTEAGEATEAPADNPGPGDYDY